MMKVSEHLQASRDLIASKDWCQRTFARDADGRPTPWGGDKCAAFCMSGAMNHVARGSTIIMARSVKTLMDIICCAIAIWNDDQLRTKEQVLSAFDAAIALAKEEGN